MQVWRAGYPDLPRDGKKRSPRTLGKLCEDYIEVMMGLCGGSNFEILPGVWIFPMGLQGFASNRSFAKEPRILREKIPAQTPGRI